MKKKRLPVFVCGILFLVLLFSCSVEEDVIVVQSKTQLIENTKKWFYNSKEPQNLTILKHTKVILWENAIVSKGDNGEIVEVPIILQDNKTTSIGTKNEFKDYHRLLFAKDKNGTFKYYDIQIFTNETNFDNLNESFNFYNVSKDFRGIITIFDVKEQTVSLLNFKSSKKSKPKVNYRDSEPAVDTCVYIGWWYEDGSFEPITQLYCIGGGGGSATVGSGTGTYGGGGSSTPAPTPVPTPCEVLKAKLKDMALQAKLEDLRSKTSLHYESGFIQNLDGTFQELSNNGNHSLSFPFTKTSMAFYHNHNNDYESEPDEYGEITLIKPIRMFSPNDINNFLILLANANRYGNSLGSISGNMTISGANYSLTFSGDMTNVSTQYFNVSWNSEALNDVYKGYMEGKNNEQSFLNFIKDIIGIDGINLSRVDLNGIINNLTLDSNNKLVSTPCN